MSNERRCRLCPSRRLPILGEGPQPARVMFIGEAPGKEENNRRDREGHGHPFIGDSGKELRHHYLKLAGLKDSQVYITNLVKCIPDEAGGNPNPQLAACCSDEFLAREIRYTQPEVIVTLGAVACHTLFPGLDLERNHGLPVQASYRDWSGVLVPVYHPAAGLRDGRMMGMIDAGFVALGEYLRGERYILGLDGQLNTDYQEVHTSLDLKAYLDAAPDPEIAIDTETTRVGVPQEAVHGFKPYSLSLSVIPGTARVIRWEDGPQSVQPRYLLSVLFNWIRHHKALTVWHNYPFDRGVCEDMGADLTGVRFTDTMAEAYHLAIPQSLKALAWRLYGMAMDDFDDVVIPHSLLQVSNWINRVCFQFSLNEQSAPIGIMAAELNGIQAVYPEDICSGEWLPIIEGVKTGSIRKAIRDFAKVLNIDLSPYRGLMVVSDQYPQVAAEFAALINASKTGAEGSIRKFNGLQADLSGKSLQDPWERWNKSWTPVDKTLATEAGAGPMPPKDIAWVPWDSVIAYSGADADATLRIKSPIRSLAGRFRRSIWL